MHNLMRDERGIVTGWLVRVLLGLAIAGLVLFDSASLVINYFGLDSTADDMAVALSTSLESIPTRSVVICDVTNPAAVSGPVFCQDAHAQALDAEATLLEASLDAEGVVHVKLRRTADTIAVEKIGFLKKYGVARAEGSSGT